MGGNTLKLNTKPPAAESTSGGASTRRKRNGSSSKRNIGSKKFFETMHASYHNKNNHNIISIGSISPKKRQSVNDLKETLSSIQQSTPRVDKHKTMVADGLVNVLTTGSFESI